MTINWEWLAFWAILAYGIPLCFIAPFVIKDIASRGLARLVGKMRQREALESELSGISSLMRGHSDA